MSVRPQTDARSTEPAQNDIDAMSKSELIRLYDRLVQEHEDSPESVKEYAIRATNVRRKAIDKGVNPQRVS